MARLSSPPPSRCCSSGSGSWRGSGRSGRRGFSTCSLPAPQPPPPRGRRRSSGSSTRSCSTHAGRCATPPPYSRPCRPLPANAKASSSAATPSRWSCGLARATTTSMSLVKSTSTPRCTSRLLLLLLLLLLLKKCCNAPKLLLTFAQSHRCCSSCFLVASTICLSSPLLFCCNKGY